MVRDLERLHAAGFDHLIIFDLEGKHSLRPFRRLSRAPYATDFTAVASPVRHYCDQRFQKLYEGDHVLLYSLGQASAQLSRFSD